MRKIFIFGNGNLSFEDFLQHYVPVLEQTCDDPDTEYLLCEFRGVDILALEWLKCKTPRVTLFHMNNRPRYLPDQFRTHVNEWTIKGGYQSNLERDLAALHACTHFLGIDFNTDKFRKSGTQKNIETCLKLKKTRLLALQ